METELSITCRGLGQARGHQSSKAAPSQESPSSCCLSKQPCVPKEWQDPSVALGKAGSNSRTQGSERVGTPARPAVSQHGGSPAPECCDAQEVKGWAKQGFGQQPAFPKSLRELAAPPAFRAHIATYHKPVCSAQAPGMAQSKAR